MQTIAETRMMGARIVSFVMIVQPRNVPWTGPYSPLNMASLIVSSSICRG